MANFTKVGPILRCLGKSSARLRLTGGHGGARRPCVGGKSRARLRLTGGNGVAPSPCVGGKSNARLRLTGGDAACPNLETFCGSAQSAGNFLWLSAVGWKLFVAQSSGPETFPPRVPCMVVLGCTLQGHSPYNGSEGFRNERRGRQHQSFGEVSPWWKVIL